MKGFERQMAKTFIMICIKDWLIMNRLKNRDVKICGTFNQKMSLTR